MQVILPHYESPESVQENYLQTLRAYNCGVHQLLHRAFSLAFERQPISATIAVIGSDGRFEKSPASPIELCAYHSGEETKHLLAGINSVINSSARNVFLQEVDIKDVTQPGINYYQNDPARAFPTRVTDSTPVYGPTSNLDIAKNKLVEEWVGPDGRHILDRVSSKTREARKIIEKNGEGTYKGTLVRHFDFETGIATYDPAKFHLSFKAGPLRTVQYSISRALIKHARKGPNEAHKIQDIVQHMPTNTTERLAYLANARCFSLTSADAQLLGRHYDYFNTLYHTSENEFLSGNTTTLVANKRDAKKRAKELLTLVDKLD